KQSFGDVRNAYLRVADAANQATDIVKLDLSEDFSTERVINVAEVYKKDGEWKVRHVAQGYGNGLVAALADFGISAA
ncbi:TerD family protein, partial [Escherichia coli]|nr:TerD family protein [Escherichia coli]EJO9114808.1 TerD family protein [Escherichia coli]